SLSSRRVATSTHLLPAFFCSTTARPFLAGANVATTAARALSALAIFLPGCTIPGSTVMVACWGAASDVWPRVATALLATSATSAAAGGRRNGRGAPPAGGPAGTVCSAWQL